ncbi:hypothetical protein [Rhodopirellula sp. MGV]|uniref:SPW repeat domain-containing protein n=1 Tax=Rhodopirellula sp. MGV TaxID=2023130 RepID=UPI000B95D7DE|nr:hypothetical protein [Rhodopirellula sp. MGV]OYP32954.1 hypothetical protein CGZ80_18815 [Rhodopirellula sp. MGV]PNY35389.1 hypothetical protein C2E31_17900 [Rhodopirellula baltica]
MWGRVVEIMTAVWLAASPFVFRVHDDSVVLWTDLGLAFLICLFSGLSYWRPTQHAHLLTLVVASGLAIWGRFASEAPTAIGQNHIVVGLFLMMIALVPNDASLPPVKWRQTGRTRNSM